MGGVQLSVKCVCVIVTSFCLLFGFSLTLAQLKGVAELPPPMFYGDIFLQYEELGFSPLGIPPEILSARGEIK